MRRCTTSHSPRTHRFRRITASFKDTSRRIRRALSRQLAGYDVVLVLGAAVFKYYPYTAGPVLEPETHVFQVTDDPSEAARAATGTSVVGDVTLAARRLCELLPDEDREAHTALPKPEAPEAASPIPVAYLMHVLGRVLPEDAVVVNESLSSEGELRRHIRMRRPDSFYGGASSGGGLGFGMPGAVGIQLAVPERPVVSVVGDGSAMYTVQALWTAARLAAPITYVIVNNSQYAILKAFAASSGISDSVPGLDLPRLDITLIAEGFGCKAETVEEPGKLEETLLRALGHEGPYLVNVMVDRAVPDLLA